MDKKIFELSITHSETDHKVYYDCSTVDLSTEESRLQILKILSTIQGFILDIHLKEKGIAVGGDALRFSKK